MGEPILNDRIIKDLYSQFNIKASAIADSCYCATTTITRRLRCLGIIPDNKRRISQPYFNFTNEESKYIWLAGIIDGEGCIGIYKQFNYAPGWGRDKDTGKIKRKNLFITNVYNWRPKLTIGNTSLPFLLFIFNVFSGTLCRIRKQKPPYKAVYAWTITGSRMYFLLDKILPFLLLKKRQAEIVLELRGKDTNGKSINESSKAMIKEIQQLNQRGVK